MRAGRQSRDERGVATIEMIGIIPVAVLIAGSILQLFLVGYAALSAESAARLAAREAAGGASPHQAAAEAEASVNSIFEPQVDVGGNLSASGDEPAVGSRSVDAGAGAEARLTVPFLGIGVDSLNITVTRYAVLPDLEE